MEQLDRQLRQNDWAGFYRAGESFGWDRQTIESAWLFMSHKPGQGEVYRAFEGQGGQQGSQPSR